MWNSFPLDKTTKNHNLFLNIRLYTSDNIILFNYKSLLLIADLLLPFMPQAIYSRIKWMEKTMFPKILVQFYLIVYQNKYQ